MRQSKTKRLKRDEVYDFIILYAKEHRGNSPSIRAIGRHFGISYETARAHTGELMNEGRLYFDDDRLIVVDSEWIPPEFAEMGV